MIMPKVKQNSISAASRVGVTRGKLSDFRLVILTAGIVVEVTVIDIIFLLVA